MMEIQVLEFLVDLQEAFDTVDHQILLAKLNQHGIFFIIIYINGIHSMQGLTAIGRHGITRERNTKRFRHAGNLFRKNLQLKMSVNSGLKAISIIGQRKPFHRQRIPESSCPRKETVDIDILVTYRNGDRKILQSIRIVSRPPSRIRKWNQLNQFR